MPKSKKSAKNQDVWTPSSEDTFHGNGLTFEELQKRYPLDHGHQWKLMRITRRGNRVMSGASITGHGSYDGYGGTAYAQYVTAIIRTDDVVAQYTVEYDEWDY